MSRRKQGRPQQRKTLDSLEKEKDLLVCGDCQTSFALQDIVLFIKHKKLCCDKENVVTDGHCRKPGGGGGANNNNNEPGEQRLEGEQRDDELSKSSSRLDDDEDPEEDEEDDDEDDEDEDSAMDTSGFSRMNGEKEEEPRPRRKRPEEGRGVSSRTPLRQKQVADAESNTTHSEPSRFICETCRSTYTSAWALLQHAQKEHGMKIYTSPSSSGNSLSTTPVPLSPLDLVVPSSSPRSGLDHRPVSSAGSGGSASPFSSNPFSSPFRLPLDTRLTHPTAISPFSRPSFNFDLINDYRLRPQLFGRGAANIDPATFGSFDRARAHLSPAFDSNYDYYSMRLKQLASSPMSAQSKSPFSANQAQPTNASGAPTSQSNSPSLDASSGASPKGDSTSPVIVLPPKLKACEFCGKSFRFQSNLVVHRRSHTGEKPYKCPLCPHACTQQSKLKRHMKTHSNKNEGESTSPSGVSKVKEEEDDPEDVDDDEEDSEDDEEDEEEEMDEAEMVEEGEEREGVAKATKSKSETTPEPGEIRHEAKRIKLEQAGDDKANDDLPSDLSMKSKPGESLLSEVMKNSGLSSISTYTEAFKAALAESQENNKDKINEKTNEKGDENSPRTGSPKSPRSGVKREPESEKDSDKDNHNKDRLYLSNKELSALERDSPASANWPAVDPIFGRLHYPIIYPDNLFFQNYSHRFPATRDVNLNSEGHNGLNLSPSVATTSSALKTDSPSIPSIFKPTLTSPPSLTPAPRRGTSSASSSPTGSLLMPSSNGSGGGGALSGKKDRRNDTCEFCGKVFKNCSNLTVHRRSHTGEKPYKCNLCSYACAQSSKLTRHMKTHGRLGKDVYTCKFCNMPFSVPSTLEKHMRKCVDNRNARLLANDSGDLSSEYNGETSRQSDSASGVY